MTEGEKLLALAERCEAAAGADRRLDYEIMTATAFPGRSYLWEPDGADHRYTASLDAAMSPVPEGWHTFMASQDRHSLRWGWHLRGGFGWKASARAATPALALCAAALRARALGQERA